MFGIIFYIIKHIHAELNIILVDVKIQSKSWFENNWMDEDLNVLLQEFSRKVRLTNVCVMRYNSITSTICKFFKAMFVKISYVKNCAPFIPFYFESILLSKKSFFLLCDMINRNYHIPTSIENRTLESNVSAK